MQMGAAGGPYDPGLPKYRTDMRRLHRTTQSALLVLMGQGALKHPLSDGGGRSFRVRPAPVFLWLERLEKLVEVVEVDGAEGAVLHLGHQPLQLHPQGTGGANRQHERHQQRDAG